MALTAEVTPGLVMVDGDLLDNDKVNAAAAPTVGLVGSIDASQAAADGYFFGTDSGSANALAITLSPAITALVDGMAVYLSAAADNTGAATLNVNGTGAKPICKHGDQPIASGDITAGQRLMFMYNAANDCWEFLSPDSNLAKSWDAFSLSISYASASTLSCAATSAVLVNGLGKPIQVSILATVVDITVSGLNGLDFGSEAISTWYYVWLIFNPTTSASGWILSTQAAHPTLPSGYVYKARLGMVRNDASGNLVSSVQIGRQVVFANLTLFNNKAAAAGGVYEVLAGADLTQLNVIVPPIAVAIQGTMGSGSASYDAAITIAADSSGRGAISAVGTAAAALVTLQDGFSAGSYFALRLGASGAAGGFWWKSYDTNARNTVKISGYTI